MAGNQMLELFMQGLSDQTAKNKEDAKRKALGGIVKSLAILLDQGGAPQTPQTPNLPPGAAISPQGGPEILPGVNLPAPPQAGPMSPAISPGTPPVSPVGGGMDMASMMDKIRGGLFPALAGAGDYAPEAVGMIHQLFGGELFKQDTKPPFLEASPGTDIIDAKGNVIHSVPNKPGKPSFGVSPKGWLTLVNPDGTTQELEGVRPPEIVKEGMRGEAARDVATIRGKYSLMGAKVRANAQKAIQRMRERAGDKINSPSKLYTFLTQKYLSGELEEDEKAVLNHLEPVIIKMGGLQMLLEAESGKSSNPAPWNDLPEEEKPPQEVQEDYSWWRNILGNVAGGTGAEKPRPDLPGGEAPVNPSIRKEEPKAPGKDRITLQGKDGKPIVAERGPDGKYYTTINGQKYLVREKGKK